MLKADSDAFARVEEAVSRKPHIAGILAGLTLAWCRSDSTAPPSSADFALYRFDDNLKTATAKAPQRPSSPRLAEPVVWKNFYTEKASTWIPRGGSMRLRNGDLLLQGDGGLPVILSPKDFPIDWSLYEAVRIRMMAEAGEEVRIKIGPDEFTQKLGPPGQYQVYRFDVNIHPPKGSRPLAIVPTDSLTGLVAVDFIELVPRRAYFHEAVGRQFLGKRDDYVNALYAHSPSSLTYNVRVPEHAKLRFRIGVAESKAVAFRVAAEGTELFRRTLEDPSAWEDGEADLSRFAGRTIKLVFETSSAQEGAVAMWANPRMTATGARSRPNILLYLVCTMRRDHMSLYGYPRDTTPFLKTLGSAGVVFEDAHAQAAWTKASVPSLMTSLSAYATGIVRENDTIPSGATTLAEQLRRAGYVTASFVTSPFAGKASGLDRGFDYVAEHRLIQRMRSEETDRGTDSAALNKVLAAWLERYWDEPFFLYAHSNDPHAPYDPPAEFEAKFANPAETAQFNRDYGLLRDRHMYGGGATISRADCLRKGIHPDRFLRRAIERYDAEIAHNDSSIERLAGKLKELGILDNTLIIVVSDHGEEFWEHGWTGHGHSLYQELTQVAWLMWNPKMLPSPKRIGEPVQLMDLVPTVLDLLKIRPSITLKGQSLLPLLRGKTFERKTPVMASRFAHPGAKPHGFVPENRTGTFALITRDWKLIWRDQARLSALPEIELYDRRTDQAETRNVSAQYPEVVRRLKAEMDQWVEAQKPVRKLVGATGHTSLSPEAIERLRSLGYIGKQ
ncbi:MAG TPA: sulfatase-like hydrolase/transferase [Bryobacteraceae bacterium]|nr:sulfatase-like hydrolase/transferase [Bryobacteraceae bacterium]